MALICAVLGRIQRYRPVTHVVLVALNSGLVTYYERLGFTLVDGQSMLMSATLSQLHKRCIAENGYAWQSKVSELPRDTVSRNRS